MKRSNKKGFTIVELVIVIAIIAVLAAVLIPTFAGVIRKANIANDTAVAKNLNTAAVAAQAADFDAAYTAAREAGYLVANLNAKASDCYFVWENDTKQFLLYDLKEKAIIYSNTEVAGDPDDSWFFAVNNTADEAAVKAVWASVSIKTLLSDIDDLAGVLAAGGTIYIDESLILTANNTLVFDKAGVVHTLNLGSAQLNTDETLNNKIPIQIKNGASVTINGGIIGASGTGIDLDGKPYQSPIRADGGNVTINGTHFNCAASPIQFSGTANLTNVTTNGYFYSFGNGNVTLKDCEANVIGEVALWVTNTMTNSGATTYDGTATLTVESGKYSTSNLEEKWGTCSVHGGTLNLKGGEYHSDAGQMFHVIHSTGKIVISGGTFNGVAFADLTVDYLEGLCANGEDVSFANGVYTIVK